MQIPKFTRVGNSLLPDATNLTMDQSIIIIDIINKIMANTTLLVRFMRNLTMVYHTNEHGEPGLLFTNK